MIFNEIYGTYYNAVSKILKLAVNGDLTSTDLNRIILRNAYSDSVLTIEPALRKEQWQLLNNDLSTPLQNEPTMPLTILQKRWIKAISLDPRVQLFQCDFSEFDEFEPLFTPAYYYIYDKYADGDDYKDPKYISHFRIILNAVKNSLPLDINTETNRGTTSRVCGIPKNIEYSEKDDKFRVIMQTEKGTSIINIGRVISCRNSEYSPNILKSEIEKTDDHVILTLIDERNTLERALLHFSHFKKEAIRLDGDKYKLIIYYAKPDKTELVIRILSFGPTVKVVAPDRFVELVSERIRKQNALLAL